MNTKNVNKNERTDDGPPAEPTKLGIESQSTRRKTTQSSSPVVEFVDGSESFLSGGVPYLKLDSGVVNHKGDFAEIDSNRRKQTLNAELR